MFNYFNSIFVFTLLVLSRLDLLDRFPGFAPHIIVATAILGALLFQLPNQRHEAPENPFGVVILHFPREPMDPRLSSGLRHLHI